MIWQWLREFFGAEPLDVAWDSDFPNSDRMNDDDSLECPDTQPTSPGLLDTLPGRLE